MPVWPRHLVGTILWARQRLAKTDAFEVTSCCRVELMSTLHVIRLRGPWEYVVLARFVPRGDAVDLALDESRDNLPSPGRVTMPADWGATLGHDFRGRVEYRRRFGCPTGITAAEQVWLVCDGAETAATISLNGAMLGPVRGIGSPAEFEITAQLRERNELLAVVESPRSSPGGLTGEVRLEIRPAGILSQAAAADG